ncbi:hypothetical protein [Dokdonia sp.]|uniref:hypothetical protein n=1 Tax=Dokdonia sp. TaxID=2024995 RepID=UPI0032638FDD
MNYNKLQKLFINKIKNDESIILDPFDVKFVVEPNYNQPKEYVTIRILVFNQVFGHGYIDQKSSESDYIKDCFSRLHDYNTDSPKWHIWGLKVLHLEESYAFQLKEINDYIASSRFPLVSQDIIVDISDVPSEPDSNGLRKYALYIVHNYKNILVKEINIYNFNSDLAHDVIAELKKKIN